MATPIGTLGNVPSQEFGGLYLPLKIPAGSNIINLFGATQSSLPFTTPRLGNSTTGYTVTAGKTFYCLAVRIYSADIAAGGNTVVLGYNNSDLGIASNLTPASPSYFFGSSTNGQTLIPTATQSTAPYVDVPLFGAFTIPAGTYPFFEVNGSGDYGIHLIGYEA